MLKSVIKLIRPSQWVKNSVLFAALVFAGELYNHDKIILSFWGFLIFCIASSAVYVFNDISDINNDKEHPIKKDRPLPSKQVSLGLAWSLWIGLAALSLVLAGLFQGYFFILVVTFLILNILYSYFLKKFVIIDVLTIAVGFVLRAHAGAVLIDVPSSKWMLINTLLLALFLGFGKRRHELVLLKSLAVNHRPSLEKYSIYFLDHLLGVVTSAVVVIYMLYSFSTEVSMKLGTENIFITIPFVVYGIFRYLYLIHLEEKGGSPTKILINDMPILATVFLWILTIIIILY